MRPHLNGMEFVRPNQADAILPFGSLMESSIATYIMTTDSRVADANEATLHLNHMPSLQALVGRNATQLWKGDAARMMMRHDYEVMTKQRLLITDDSAEHYTGANQAMLTFKMPLYRDNSVSGVLGFTLQIDSKHVTRLASQLSMLMQTNIIKADKINEIQQALCSTENKIYFSKRESQVLGLVVKGYTAKKISDVLGLSKRTVEHHIDNIKLKAGCSRKYELIYKFANYYVSSK